ncbi:MAG: hypothetical protein WA610_06000 [Thermodesulfovibrionales bacterium]
MLFLIASFFGSEGTLICFGKDGHVAIEFVDVCNGSNFGSQFADSEKSDACGPCQDVQFLGSPAYTNNASHDTQTFRLIFSSAPLSSLPRGKSSGKFVVPLPSSHQKILAGLHSVILLI